jgi:predicted DNA binding CopG/RHH family protein
MTEERKDTVIQIRLSSKLLSSFKSKCENSVPKIIPAKWLRNNIEMFVKDDEK